VIKTGGTWNPEERGIYFVAATWEDLDLTEQMHQQLLLAVNVIRSDGIENLRQGIADGTKVFIDSGIYDLNSKYAAARGIEVKDAVATAPEHVTGFDALWDRYVEVVRAIGDISWGYVEMDQGGRENKIRLRTKLENLGLRPIPVYHPLSDGWDYFDYLAERYDRICLANVSHANRGERKRLLATIWERRQKYPHLWIHVLGLTPTDHCISYPVESMDSSAWMNPVIYGSRGAALRVALSRFDNVPLGLIYSRDVAADHNMGGSAASAFCAYDAMHLARNLKNVMAEYRRVL